MYNKGKMELELKQNQLDKVYSWLKTTTEPFDDWDWDGDNLYIFFNNELSEKYSINDLKEFIECL